MFKLVCPGGCAVLVGMPGEPIRYDVVAAQTKEARVEHVFRYANVVARGAADRLDPVKLDPDSTPLAIIYTSGTMGKPKGVVLTHSNLTHTPCVTADLIGLTDSDRMLMAVPLFTAFGVHMCIGTLLEGGSVVLLDWFDSTAALDLMELEGVTHCPGVPTQR